MPLYKVNFSNNAPTSATEISGSQYHTLKEFETVDGQTNIKWYIVQALSEDNAIEIAGKLVYQIWGDILLSRKRTVEG
jgi:hypothetical protein